jgi:hypothetical protein
MAELQAGLAVQDITPPVGVHLQGYTRGPSTGIRDRLQAKALVLDDGTCRVALVTADLLGLDDDLVQRVRARVEQRTGIPSNAVLIACSHTHSGPAIQTLGYLPVHPDYQQLVAERLVTVVGEAATAPPVAVRLGAGTGEVRFNVNRRVRRPSDTPMLPNPHGPADRRVRVFRLDPADAPLPPGTLGGALLPQAELVALLFSYSCHPTVLDGRNLRISGDYPGMAQRFIEHAYDSDDTSRRPVAMFLPGCFGNVRPYLLNAEGRFRGGTDYELRALGRMLGAEVVKVAEQITTEPVESIAAASQRVWLPYAKLPSPDGLRALLGTGPQQDFFARRFLEILDREGKLPEGEEATIQVIRLGRHWLVATPGETFQEIGLSIEAGLVEYGLADPSRGDQVWALGYSNGNVGYLCTALSHSEGGYEPGRAHIGYLRPGPFAPDVEALLISTALALAWQLGPAR